MEPLRHFQFAMLLNTGAASRITAVETEPVFTVLTLIAILFCRAPPRFFSR